MLMWQELQDLAQDIIKIRSEYFIYNYGWQGKLVAPSSFLLEPPCYCGSMQYADLQSYNKIALIYLCSLFFHRNQDCIIYCFGNQSLRSRTNIHQNSWTTSKGLQQIQVRDLKVCSVNCIPRARKQMVLTSYSICRMD